MIDRIAQLEQQYASAKNNATALRDAWHQATWNVSHEEAEPLRKAADEASKAATDCWAELQQAKFGADWQKGIGSVPDDIRYRQGKSSDVIALAKMATAEDDDAEVCLDSAGQSHNGDEFESVGWMHPETARLSDEELAFERDLIDAKATADEALLDIADFLLAGNATWRAAKRMHRSIEQFAEAYA